VIYCVVPRELEADLYDRLVTYYADNPGVTVIVDRRTGPDRRHPGTTTDVEREQRHTRDRRRPRTTGSFASTDVLDP
jgi:hypothetical protein